MGDDARTELLSRLLDTYGTALLRLCYLYLGDAALAEDATQDTFIKAYRHLDRFLIREIESEKAWLTRIAVNTCRDYRRGAWFRHVDRSAGATAILERTDAAATPEAQWLIEDVLSLPPRLREVLLLHYYQDLTVEEIGGILRKPKSTIYARLKRAKEALRALLEGRGGDA